MSRCNLCQFEPVSQTKTLSMKLVSYDSYGPHSPVSTVGFKFQTETFCVTVTLLPVIIFFFIFQMDFNNRFGGEGKGVFTET